jgi:hypothetical protein
LSQDELKLEHQSKKIKTIEIKSKQEDSNDNLTDDDIIFESNCTNTNVSNNDEIVECSSNSNSQDSDIKEIKISSDDDIVEVEEVTSKPKLIAIVDDSLSPSKKHKVSNTNGHNVDDDVIAL